MMARGDQFWRQHDATDCLAQRQAKASQACQAPASITLRSVRRSFRSSCKTHSNGQVVIGKRQRCRESTQQTVATLSRVNTANILKACVICRYLAVSVLFICETSNSSTRFTSVLSSVFVHYTCIKHLRAATGIISL